MKATELIEKLKEHIKEHGDGEVFFSDIDEGMLHVDRIRPTNERDDWFTYSFAKGVYLRRHE